MGHPDEAVKPEGEVPSRLVAEAQHRHEVAGTDAATAQEKKQAAVEQAHALSTRPDGSYAQLHEVTPGEGDLQGGPSGPQLAVADKEHLKGLQKQQKEALESGRVAPREDPAKAQTAKAGAVK